MKYRRFGRTEIEMPLVSVGGMRFQTSWEREDGVDPNSVSNLDRIMAHALELGMNHFETAHGYGTSEEELGRVLPNYDRSRLILQSKGEPSGKVNGGACTIETSLRALKVDYLDLFAVHGVNTDAMADQALRKDGLVDKVLTLKERGVVRGLGFSTHGPPETILRLIRTGVFDYVNLWYSYINQSNWPAIVEARKQDMGVFIISPNDKGGQLYRPSQRLRTLTAPLSPMTFNDIFILRHPEIHTISCGASRPEDLDEHQQAVARLDTLRETVTVISARMEEALAGVHGSAWKENFAQGLPSWQETPGQVNLPVILWLWNLVQAFDMVDYARFRYNLLGEASHWFPGNKVDGALPHSEGPLREALARSPYCDRIIDVLYQAHALLDGPVGARLGSD